MNKRPYDESSVFLVPLNNGGHVPGVIARMCPRGETIIGCFFYLYIDDKDQIDYSKLKPEKTDIVIRFGYLGLKNKEWPVLGSLPNWERKEWPMTKFIWRDITGLLKPKLVEYYDNDPSKIKSEKTIYFNRNLPEDSLSGHKFVENKLSKLVR